MKDTNYLTIIACIVSVWMILSFNRNQQYHEQERNRLKKEIKHLKTDQYIKELEQEYNLDKEYLEHIQRVFYDVGQRESQSVKALRNRLRGKKRVLDSIKKQNL